MYTLGEGVIRDDIYAYMWMSVAASNGNGSEKVEKLIDSLSKRMTPSQITEAQKLARECVAKNYKGC